MAKHHRVTKDKQDKKTQRRAKRVAAELANEQADQASLAQLQQQVGNRAVQSLLAQSSGDGPASTLLSTGFGLDDVTANRITQGHGGRKLLGHELTHGVQQNGAEIQRAVIQRWLSQRQVIARADRLREILRGRELVYAELDRILVTPSPEDVLQVYQQYVARYGAIGFTNDLTWFVAGIPTHEGRSREEIRSDREQMWDRYAARLYDAGVRHIQARFFSARPIPITPQNQALLLARWRRYIVEPGGPWRGRDFAPLARWILQRWEDIQGYRAVRDRGWMPPLSGETYRASFSWLSENQLAHEAGFDAAQNYWSSIHSNYLTSLSIIIDQASQYNESYVATHSAGPLGWNPFARHRPVPRGLEQGMRDWHAINSAYGQLPNPEGGWVSHWEDVLGVWIRNEYPRSSLMQSAGFRAAAGAAP